MQNVESSKVHSERDSLEMWDVSDRLSSIFVFIIIRVAVEELFLKMNDKCPFSLSLEWKHEEGHTTNGSWKATVYIDVLQKGCRVYSLFYLHMTLFALSRHLWSKKW